jgi:hypothetical protein
MAGLVVTAGNIHLQVGVNSRKVDDGLDELIELKEFFDQHTADDLVTKFGMTLADANLVKSAYNADAADAVTAFRASQHWAFMKQLMGMGSV